MREMFCRYCGKRLSEATPEEILMDDSEAFAYGMVLGLHRLVCSK
jgi:hypothetical protein